jgi:hypothetical protein
MNFSRSTFKTEKLVLIFLRVVNEIIVFIVLDLFLRIKFHEKYKDVLGGICKSGNF